jgi:hypothetical protein
MGAGVKPLTKAQFMARVMMAASQGRSRRSLPEVAEYEALAAGFGDWLQALVAGRIPGAANDVAPRSPALDSGASDPADEELERRAVNLSLAALRDDPPGLTGAVDPNGTRGTGLQS